MVKVPWPELSRLEKCADEARLGVNQYSSHLMQEWGGKIWLSSHIDGGEGAPGGFLDRGVLQ